MFSPARTPLADVVATLDELASAEFGEWSDGELAALVSDWSQAMSRLQALGAAVLGVWDARSVWALDASASGAAWLRAHGEVDRPGVRVAHARVLNQHAPRTLAALVAGDISYEKASTIAAGVTAELAPQFALSEDTIVEAARTLSVAQVRQLMAGWKAVAEDDLDPDTDPDDKKRQRRRFRANENLDGMFTLQGNLDPEQGAAFVAAVEARTQDLYRHDVRQARLAAGLDPDERSEEGLDLGRTATQRRADALVELVTLGSGVNAEDPDVLGGPSAHLYVEVDAETLAEIAAEQVRRSLTLPGTDLHAAIEAIDNAVGEGTLAARVLSSALREHASARHLADHAADSAIARARGGGLGHLDDVDHPASDQLIAMMACDCILHRITLDPRGVPIDLGRSQRLVSRHLRRLLRRRDHGCAFPGCDRPPSWCDAHHIIPWEIGGPTNLNNLVLLCRKHHRDMHAKVPWGCRINPATGQPEFTRPDGTPMPQPGLPPRTRPPDRRPPHGRPPDPPPRPELTRAA